jgi:hypothetical protein
MKPSHGMAAAAVVAFGVAGCYNGEHLAPLVPTTATASSQYSGPNIETRIKLGMIGRKVTAVPGALGRLLAGRLPPGSTSRSYVLPGAHSGCIYLADNLLGIMYLYDSASLKPIGQLTSPDSYGWGVTATTSSVYAGTFADTIDEYKPCSGTSPTKSLRGAGYGYPYGIAIAKDGTTYANEFPTNLVDVWTASGEHHLTKKHDEGASYFLAVDAQGNVYSAGWDNSFSDGIVDRCDRLLKKCVTIVSGIYFPGGIAFDQHENLYVNDQAALGNFTSVIEEFSGCASPKPNCHLIATADDYHNEFTAIALDTRDKNLYGAADSVCSTYAYYTCGYAMGLLVPISKFIISGQTSPVQTADPLGIAYWKPSSY